MTTTLQTIAPPRPFGPPPRRKVQPVTWSGEQESIFDYFQSGEGNCVIRARAGTGKTTTARHGFALAPENRMLYAVFNKKNQREAEEKIRDPRVEVKTLHAIGYRFITQYWNGVKPDDAVELARLLEVSVEPPKEMISPILKLLGFAKNCFIEADELDLVEIAEEKMPDVEWWGVWTVEHCARIVLKILELSKRRDELNRISFNDMVWLPVALNIVRARYELVLVDEAQDMNLPQLTMARRASKGRVIVVGDDRQCIYGFRGAVHDGLSMMKSELNAIELPLSTTYRCPKKVVALARQFVPDYNAAEQAPDGIVDSIGESQLSGVVKIGDAILSRANAPLMPLCLSLIRQKPDMPIRIEGRDIGKQLLSTVQKLKAKSVPDFLGRITAWATKMKNRLSKKKDCESKVALIDDQAETLTAVAEGCNNVAEIENRIRDLFQDSDSSSRPAVILSTVHKAKGLEWNRVFIVRKTFLRRDNREEENIYYVAITRAKAHLTFIGCEPKENRYAK